VQALVKSSKDVDYTFSILNSVMEVNERQKTILLPKIKKFFNNDLSGKHIAIWGLAFKPDTDDIREAPALYIIDELLAAGATVSAYDPEAMPNVKKLGKKVDFAKGQYEALENADALVICTEWAAFRTPDFTRMLNEIKSKVIFDGRNLYSNDQIKKIGLNYFSIGRKSVRKSK
jgi:UDPglucose 6-dehydrogenase